MLRNGPHSSDAANSQDAPLTWNEAAHQARAESQPEYMGHKDCPTCDEGLRARAALDARREALAELTRDGQEWPGGYR